MRLGRRTRAAEAPETEGSIAATMTGTITNSQVAVGNANVQTQTVTTTVTEAEIGELRALFACLKEQVVTADVPADRRVAAIEQVAALEQATLGDEPDLTTMRKVGRWFADNLPALAGSVTGLLVHPTVGKIVGAAGDALMAELRT